MRRVKASMMLAVLAVFALGATAQSVAAAATTPASVVAVASATSSGAIDITWQDQNPDPFFFQVQVLNTAGSVVTSKTVSGTLSQTTVSGLTNGEGYRVVVKAIADDGSIAAANPVGPVTPYGIPDTPTIGSVTPASCGSR